VGYRFLRLWQPGHAIPMTDAASINQKYCQESANIVGMHGGTTLIEMHAGFVTSLAMIK
jgi:hypothetical protein